MNMPHGRTLADFGLLRSAERQLLEAWQKGETCVLGTSRPDAETKDNRIRAEFLRFLSLGGEAGNPVHEKGIRLQGAWITEQLDLNACRVPVSWAVTHSHFQMAILMLDAEFCVSMSLTGSHILGLTADGAVIKGGVFLSHGFSAQGAIRLLGAQIGGNLDCTRATLKVEKGDALSADGAVIKGDVFLRDHFSAQGEIRLLGAQIGGDLSCTGATLEVEKGDALSADGAVIKGGVFLSHGFSAQGTIRLLGAQIGGVLSCIGATLEVEKGYALSADRAVIKGSVFLDGFSAQGEIRLLGAQIGGDLYCTGAKLEGKEGYALAADGMVVSGSFFFCGLKSPVRSVRLSSAKVGRLLDDADSWGSDLALDGFVYDHLAGRAPTDAQTRLAWLNKQSTEFLNESFRPQPWKQLQAVLEKMGHQQDADLVGIAFEDHLHQIGRYRGVAKVFHAGYKCLIGYGYLRLRLLYWMLGVWLLCAALYGVAAYQGIMAPSHPLVFQNKDYAEKCKNNWYLCKELPDAYTGFQPLMYSLDVLLPLVDLQQERDWAARIPTPQATFYQEIGHWTWAHGVRIVMWLEILFGWLASLILVAVLTGLRRRRADET